MHNKSPESFAIFVVVETKTQLRALCFPRAEMKAESKTSYELKKNYEDKF